MSEDERDTSVFPYGQCELVDVDGERCGNPLPPPAVDEMGRRKGGKPSKYCTKAHADAASRLRRRTAATVTDDGLRRAAEMADRLEPVLREQAVGVTALAALLTEVRDGAIGRVQAAEAGEADARREARDAEDRAEAAGREKGIALAQARDARAEKERADKARDAAEREQRAAGGRADAAVESERRAWQENTDLNQKLGRYSEALQSAVAARDAVERARDLLAERLRTEAAAHADEVTALRAQLDALHLENRELAARLTEAEAAGATAAARAIAAERLAEQATGRAESAEEHAEVSRSAVEQASRELVAAKGDTMALQRLLDRAEDALRSARAESADLRERAATSDLLRTQAEQRLAAASTPPASIQSAPPPSDPSPTADKIE